MKSMGKTIILGGFFLVVVINAWGGSEQIIKERAKELSNQNNVRQGVAPPSQPGQPGQPGQAAPAPPTVEEQNLSRFQATLAGIKADEPVTELKKQQLVAYLAGAVQGSSKPTAAALKKFVDDLTAAVGQKQLAPDKRARLVQEIDAVLNPAKYPQAKMGAIYADLQAIFQVNGSSRNEAVNLVEDIKALSPSAQTSAAK